MQLRFLDVKHLMAEFKPVVVVVVCGVTTLTAHAQTLHTSSPLSLPLSHFPLHLPSPISLSTPTPLLNAGSTCRNAASHRLMVPFSGRWRDFLILLWEECISLAIAAFNIALVVPKEFNISQVRATFRTNVTRLGYVVSHDA